MRSIASCFAHPDALIASINSVQTRIGQRHHSIRHLTTACRQQMKAVATSWPVLMATCLAGFMFGAYIRRPQPNLATANEQQPSSKAARAFRLVARALLVSKHLF